MTSTDVSFKAKVDFPAVTICNLNRINCHNAFEVVLENIIYQYLYNSNEQATFKLIDTLADKEGRLSTDQYDELNSTLGIMQE